MNPRQSVQAERKQQLVNRAAEALHAFLSASPSVRKRDMRAELKRSGVVDSKAVTYELVEVVPELVGFEVAVPRLMPAVW